MCFRAHSFAPFQEDEIPVKPGLTAMALIALLSLNLNLSPDALAQEAIDSYLEAEFRFHSFSNNSYREIIAA